MSIKGKNSAVYVDTAVQLYFEKEIKHGHLKRLFNQFILDCLESKIPKDEIEILILAADIVDKYV